MNAGRNQIYDLQQINTKMSGDVSQARAEIEALEVARTILENEVSQSRIRMSDRNMENEVNILKERINVLENINREVINEKDNIDRELSVLSK